MLKVVKRYKTYSIYWRGHGYQLSFLARRLAIKDLSDIKTFKCWLERVASYKANYCQGVWERGITWKVVIKRRGKCTCKRPIWGETSDITWKGNDKHSWKHKSKCGKQSSPGWNSNSDTIFSWEIGEIENFDWIKIQSKCAKQQKNSI